MAREAKADGKPFLHHLSHLAVHGFLHLIGYDHQQNQQAEAMERLERRVLARLKVPDPYAGAPRPFPRTTDEHEAAYDLPPPAKKGEKLP